MECLNNEFPSELEIQTSFTKKSYDKLIIFHLLHKKPFSLCFLHYDVLTSD